MLIDKLEAIARHIIADPNAILEFAPDEMATFGDLVGLVAARNPAFRARLDAAVEEAWAWVREVEASGRLRVIVHQADGMVAIEVVERRLH